jgi:hypothetical protein
MPTFYAPVHVRQEFDRLMIKLDRARTDDKRLKLIKDADELLRSNLFGWDAVHVRPDKLYKLRAKSRVPGKAHANGTDPQPLPTAPPSAVLPTAPMILRKVSTVEVEREARRFTMSAEGRMNLRSVLRLHPNYTDYARNMTKHVETWTKVEMVKAAMEFGIDLDHMFPTTTVVIPVQPKQLELEDAIREAKLVAQASERTPAPIIDGDANSIEYKGYAVELSERESLTEGERRYFKLLAKLNRSLNPSEFDKIAEVYTAP